MKTVYQTDADGLFLYEAQANELPFSPGRFNIPFGAHNEAPPEKRPGMVARRAGSQWVMVEDHRKTPLWEVETGQVYAVGTRVNVNGTDQAYPGWGPLPSWLTSTEPDAPSTEPVDGVANA
ncbi:phage tail protein [Achromobacter xylosoxidans]